MPQLNGTPAELATALGLLYRAQWSVRANPDLDAAGAGGAPAQDVPEHGQKHGWSFVLFREVLSKWGVALRAGESPHEEEPRQVEPHLEQEVEPHLEQEVSNPISNKKWNPISHKKWNPIINARVAEERRKNAIAKDKEARERGVVREAALSPGEAACNAAIASTTGVLKNVLEKKAKEPHSSE